MEVGIWQLCSHRRFKGDATSFFPMTGGSNQGSSFPKDSPRAQQQRKVPGSWCAVPSRDPSGLRLHTFLPRGLSGLRGLFTYPQGQGFCGCSQGSNAVTRGQKDHILRRRRAGMWGTHRHSDPLVLPDRLRRNVLLDILPEQFLERDLAEIDGDMISPSGEQKPV